MTPLAAAAFFIYWGVCWIWFVFEILAGLMSLWALVDCLMRDPQHFLASGKRTKGFWIAVNAAGLAVVALMCWGAASGLLVPGRAVPVPSSGGASMLGLLGFVANAVYLADVRPALAVYTPVRVRSRVRRPGEGRDGRGSSGPGWRR